MTVSRTKTPTTMKALAAVALAIAAFTAPLASAQAAAPQNNGHNQAQQHDDRRGQNDRNDNDRNGRNGGQADRYGNWNASWGARPSAPPRSFTRTADWHRHVRACQVRYRSYNPATDRYTVRRGQTAMCRL
jgi:hypothetical protein